MSRPQKIKCCTMQALTPITVVGSRIECQTNSATPRYAYGSSPPKATSMASKVTSKVVLGVHAQHPPCVSCPAPLAPLPLNPATRCTQHPARQVPAGLWIRWG